MVLSLYRCLVRLEDPNYERREKSGVPIVVVSCPLRLRVANPYLTMRPIAALYTPSLISARISVPLNTLFLSIAQADFPLFSRFITALSVWVFRVIGCPIEQVRWLTGYPSPVATHPNQLSPLQVGCC